MSSAAWHFAAANSFRSRLIPSYAPAKSFTFIATYSRMNRGHRNSALHDSWNVNSLVRWQRGQVRNGTHTVFGRDLKTMMTLSKIVFDLGGSHRGDCNAVKRVIALPTA